MVKIQRLITINAELNDRLKGEENASGLINSLLLSHFDYLETDNLELLESKKLEKCNQREILDKELEHITDKIIVINNRKKEEYISEEKKQRLKELKGLADEINNQWKNDEIGEDEYWERIDNIQKEKEELKKKL